MGSSVNGTFVNYTPAFSSPAEPAKSSNSSNERNIPIEEIAGRNIKNVDRSSSVGSLGRIKRRVCTPYNIIKGAFWSCLAISAIASGVLLREFTSFSSPTEGNDLYISKVKNVTSSSTGEAFNTSLGSSFTGLSSSSIFPNSSSSFSNSTGLSSSSDFVKTNSSSSSTGSSSSLIFPKSSSSSSSSTGSSSSSNLVKSSSSSSSTGSSSSSISPKPSSSSSSSTGSIVSSSSSSTGRKLTPTTVASAKLLSRTGERFSTITFNQHSSDEVRAVIDGFIYDALGILPEVTIKAGIHIYNASSCEEADGGLHFNPDGNPHAKIGTYTGTYVRRTYVHHAGDLGNVFISPNLLSASFTVYSTLIAFDGPHNIVGLPVLVRYATDDFTSQPTGNPLDPNPDREPYLACGIIQADN